MTADDPWAGLWNTPSTPTPTRPALPKLPPIPSVSRIPQHERPLPELRLPSATCKPHCIRCHENQFDCPCDPPALICHHVRWAGNLPPASTKDRRTNKVTGRFADLRLVRVRTIGHLTDGRNGYQILVVRDCPHCHRVHVHSSHPNAGPYRIGACRQPYLLEITTP